MEGFIRKEVNTLYRNKGNGQRIDFMEYGETLRVYQKENREHPTKSERAAMNYLRGKKYNFIFQEILYGKKKIYGKQSQGYIADFYFPDFRLVLEIDGGYHNDKGQKIKDKERTKDLEAAGYKVVRMTEADVSANNYPKIEDYHLAELKNNLSLLDKERSKIKKEIKELERRNR